MAAVGDYFHTLGDVVSGFIGLCMIGICAYMLIRKDRHDRDELKQIQELNNRRFK